MKKYGRIAAAGVALVMCMTGISSYADEKGTITSMSEKVYGSMDEESSVVANVIMGSTFSLLRTEHDTEGNTWYFIQTDAGASGYIKAENVTSADKVEETVADAQEKALDDMLTDIPDDTTETSQEETDIQTTVSQDINDIIGIINEENNSESNNGIDRQESVETQYSKFEVEAIQTINIRKDASTSYAVVGRLPKGAVAEGVSTKKNSSGETWYEIIYNGTQGYVMSTVVNVTELEDDSADELTTEEETTQEQASTEAIEQSSQSEAVETVSQAVKTDEQTEVESELTSESETSVAVKAKRSKFVIDWAVVFSLCGSVLCIAVIYKLLQRIKKLFL